MFSYEELERAAYISGDLTVSALYGVFDDLKDRVEDLEERVNNIEEHMPAQDE